ncbi:3-dehydroquinate synthase [Aureococcus anophagefferens]|nr:3-dehydroquinate synthase [Aureococcus anophagefferens]
MAHDEGCLVGSSAKALALVLGETATGGFVPPRPFRCNAGPVHSYVAMADGKTKYSGKKGNVFLQQAETVRLAGAAGDPLAVTKAKAGDRVLVAFDDRGTHVGGRISVRVDER